ncbi:hypothetical protein ES702_06885 [subsurface metagenome]
MEYLDQPFQVSTGSSRRPTPLAYEHLRKYAELVKQYLRITNQSSLVNVNELLNLTGNLYVSNEVSRVIAQIIGQTALGFVTIKGTDDGALHVYPMGGVTPGYYDVKIADGDDATLGAIADAIVAAGAEGTISAKLRRLTQGLEDLKTTVSLAAGTNLIGKVQLAGMAITPLKAKIDINTAATHDIIAAVSAKKHYITTIVLTTGGQTNLILRDESAPFTGGMDFGGTDEPRGMVSNHPLVPLVCTTNEKFQIVSSGAVQVSGYVLYYDQP